MDIYIVQLFIIIFLTLIPSVKSLMKVKFILIWLTLSVPMGLRGYSVGTDTLLYKGIFERLGQSSFSSYNESSWFFLMWNKVIYYFSSEYGVYLLITALLTNYLILKAILIFNNDKFSSSIYLYYILYFYYTSFNISRQYLAIAFILFGSAMLYRKKNYVVYFISIILAVGIHNTAIFSLLILLLLRLKWSKKNVILIFMITFFIGKVKAWILSIFSNFFPHYKLYLDTDTIATVAQGNKIYLYVFLILLLLVVVFYSNNNDLQEHKGLIYITTVGLAMGFFFSKDILLGRVEIYFTIFSICLYSFIIKKFSMLFMKKNYPGQMLISYALYLILFIPYIFQLIKNISGILSYYPWYL